VPRSLTGVSSIAGDAPDSFERQFCRQGVTSFGCAPRRRLLLNENGRPASNRRPCSRGWYKEASHHPG
jgi:hypothetical protein